MYVVYVTSYFGRQATQVCICIRGHPGVFCSVLVGVKVHVRDGDRSRGCRPCLSGGHLGDLRLPIFVFFFAWGTYKGSFSGGVVSSLGVVCSFTHIVQVKCVGLVHERCLMLQQCATVLLSSGRYPGPSSDWPCFYNWT